MRVLCLAILAHCTPLLLHCHEGPLACTALTEWITTVRMHVVKFYMGFMMMTECYRVVRWVPYHHSMVRPRVAGGGTTSSYGG
jgi:hypothetical protein